MAMTAQDKTYYEKAKHIIEKANPEWKLSGFYNSLLIRKSYITSYTYLVKVVRFLNEINKSIEKIDIDTYTEYLVSLKELKQSTQITTYHALKSYSKYLAAREITAKDYMSFIDRPKFFETEEQKERRENGFLTKKEAQKVISNAENFNGFIKSGYKDDAWSQRNKTIIMLFLNTGIRSSAMINLNINDVDLENKTISVMEKGSKARKIAISQSVVLELRIWLRERERLLRDHPEETALFISSKKTRIGYQGVYNIIKSCSSDIQGKNITPHKLRATYATNLYEESRDLFFVQKRMGHESPTTTKGYIHNNQSDDAQRAADIMEKFFE